MLRTHFPKKCYNNLKVLIQVDLLETGYHYKFLHVFRVILPNFTLLTDDRANYRAGWGLTRRKKQPSLDRRKCYSSMAICTLLCI